MSFETVGCAETRASGERQERRGVWKACVYEGSRSMFLLALRPAALVSTLCHAVVTLIFRPVAQSRLRAEPMCSVHVMQLLVPRAN